MLLDLLLTLHINIRKMIRGRTASMLCEALNTQILVINIYFEGTLHFFLARFQDLLLIN